LSADRIVTLTDCVRLVALLAIVSTSLYVSPAKAEAPAREWMTPKIEAPRVSYHSFESRAASSQVSYHLYTPAGYSVDGQRRYPVVYWLHGSGGGLRGIRPLAQLVDEAIEAGRVPPFLMVFVNGLRLGMYVDWKDGSAPLETLITGDLVPHIDANYRTIATREGRLLDGFSMGGYGAARLGFKFPELFGSVSIVGAGPLQDTLTQAPRASGKTAADVMREVYGNDPAHFVAVSPRQLAKENAARLREQSRMRLVIGDRDNIFSNNQDFHEHLVGLGIPHDWIIVEGVGHDPMGILQALGDQHWAFYREAFDPKYSGGTRSSAR
jgi:enterochelin esterase-like enzyme